MKVRITSSFNEKIVFVLLFLFAIGCLNLSGHIIAAVLMFHLITTYRSQYAFDVRAFMLLFFSSSYFLNYSMFGDIGIKEIITYLIAPLGCYLFGQNFVLYSNKDQSLDRMLLVLAIGFYLHGILNFYEYIQIYGIENIGRTEFRVAFDFWRKEIIAVTSCSLYYVPLMSIALGYLFYGKKKLEKTLSFIIIAIGLFANVAYANRTIIYLIALLVIIRLFYLISKRKVNFKIASICLLGIVIISYGLYTDVFDIRTQILNLNIAQRLVGDDVGRISVWINFFESDWWRYPFGGKNGNLAYGYAHNLWIDTLHTVGFAPFIFLLIFTIFSFDTVKRFYQNSRIDKRVYVYLIGGMAISCGVEPIIESNPYYFLMLLMIIGSFEGQMKKMRRIVRKKRIVYGQ